MRRRAIAALAETVRPNVAPRRDRTETLAMIVAGMVGARAADLAHPAAERPGTVQVSSTCRRRQRFFRHVRLERDRAAPMVEKPCAEKESGKGRPALDRTRRQVGGRDVDHLAPAAAPRRFRAPSMRTMIDGRGCSDAGQRLEPMQRRLDPFGVESIRFLLIVREFVGRERMDFPSETTSPSRPSRSGCAATCARSPVRAAISRSTPACAAAAAAGR